jgi:hypothetical protein
MWDLWRTNRQWDRFFFEFFGFALSVSFYRGSPYSCFIWRMNRPVGGRSSETLSHSIDTNNKCEGNNRRVEKILWVTGELHNQFCSNVTGVIRLKATRCSGNVACTGGMKCIQSFSPKS